MGDVMIQVITMGIGSGIRMELIGDKIVSLNDCVLK